jgi:hypothetical protein
MSGRSSGSSWIAQSARDYAIPEVEVEAALAFYRRHRHVLDARHAGHTILPALI